MKTNFLPVLLTVCLVSSQSFAKKSNDDSAAKDDSAKVLSDLHTLYPDLSENAFQIKLTGIADDFHFLRTFVSYYYFLLSQNTPEKLNPSLAAENGWCVGDAHQENFGVVVNRQGQAKFTMNDLDDGGPCPLYADFLRLLVAATLADSKISREDMIKAYISALNGTPVAYSKIVKKMIADSENQNVLDDSLLNKNQTQFLLDKGIVKAISDEFKMVSDALQSDAFQKEVGAQVTVVDVVAFTKDSGGSGGLRRYRALIAYNDSQNRKTQDIIELKTIDRPGVRELATGDLIRRLAKLSDAQRYEASIKWEEGNDFESDYSFQPVGGQEMLLRPRWMGNVGIRIDKIQKKYGEDGVNQIAVDEAAKLGEIHSRSADTIKNYILAVTNTSAADWINMADAVAKEIHHAYKVTVKDVK